MNSLARWIRKSPCTFTRVGWICVSCMHKIQEKQQQWYIPTLRTPTPPQPTPPGRRRCPVPRSARHSWRSGAHRAPSCCRKCVDGFVRRDLRWLRWGLFILFDVCLFFVVVLEFFWNKSVSFCEGSMFWSQMWNYIYILVWFPMCREISSSIQYTYGP